MFEIGLSMDEKLNIELLTWCGNTDTQTHTHTHTDTHTDRAIAILRKSPSGRSNYLYS